MLTIGQVTRNKFRVSPPSLGSISPTPMLFFRCSSYSNTHLSTPDYNHFLQTISTTSLDVLRHSRNCRSTFLLPFKVATDSTRGQQANTDPVGVSHGELYRYHYITLPEPVPYKGRVQRTDQRTHNNTYMWVSYV